jgi:hypothetical protein
MPVDRLLMLHPDKTRNNSAIKVESIFVATIAGPYTDR